jgi:hypothetical protein
MSIIFCIAFWQNENCQSLSPVEFNTAGIEVVSKKYSLSYSIGGTMVNTLNNEKEILTQGFQQPNIYIVTSIHSAENLQVSVCAFPNPATEYINIKLSNISIPETCSIEITNSMGRVCDLSQEYYEFHNNREVSVDVSRLKSGIYQFSLISERDNRKVAFFRMVKIE